MATREEAFALLDKQAETNNQEELQVISLLRSWLSYQEEAAGFIMAEGKSPKGCYKAMYDKAFKASRRKCVGNEDAAEWVLEYYGAPDPKALLEGGLYYKMIVDAAENYRPYGAEPFQAAPVAPVAKPSAPAETAGADDSLEALLADF